MSTTTDISKIKKGNFSHSTNIIRDREESLLYLPTPNSKLLFNSVIRAYRRGTHSFAIIGAYGTGKSSFILAFEKAINKKHKYFGSIGKSGFPKSFEFAPIIGRYNSLINTFADKFGINNTDDYTPEDVLDKIDTYYRELHNKKSGLLIAVDEFGKYLEYAAKNGPERELYFIQQLAEYINDNKKHIFFITILHQGFSSYANGLSKSQRYEWDKVKGRLKELPFNEPVEQLLYLAAKELAIRPSPPYDSKKFINLFEIIDNSNIFPLRDYFTKEIAENILPFDILSAAVLTLALQKYGQNERSLFSFIYANDYLGLDDVKCNKNQFFNLANVYDYLLFNFHSLLTSKYNPHYAQWSSIQSALERSENSSVNQLNDTKAIIKTIGLLSIFSTQAASIDLGFLKQYSQIALGIRNAEEIIENLEFYQIIRFVNHQNRFKLFEGTDLDIELALDEAGNLIEVSSDVVPTLTNYFDFPLVMAKEIYFKTGTPRLFQYRLSNLPIEEIPQGEIDGYINLVFSSTIKENKLIKISSENQEATLYGWVRNVSEIQNQIYEIEKVKKVKEQNLDDHVAVRELDSIIHHQKNLLKHFIVDSLHEEDSQVKWYFNGKHIPISNQTELNKLLSQICYAVYDKTPYFNNELVNRTKLSGAISTARKKLIAAIVNHWDKENLGFVDNKFPPEKTIYLSLLRSTEIHSKDVNRSYYLGPPKEDSTFSNLWEFSHSFIEESKYEKTNLRDFQQALLKKPFKLKEGFIEFWLPIVLFINRDRFALYGREGYIPELTDSTLELVLKKPQNFSIKAFDTSNIKYKIFSKYRSMLQQDKTVITNESLIETIKPFLTFYSGLTSFAKTTKQISNRAQALRDVITHATDPEETFFTQIPLALGYSEKQFLQIPGKIRLFIDDLQKAVLEIQSAQIKLIDRVDQYIAYGIFGDVLLFPGYKQKLIERFKGLKLHLLRPEQKVLHARINSTLDERDTWLSSICQAIVGKSLDQFTDDFELVFYDKFREKIHELDNLCEISAEIDDDSEDDIIKLELTDTYGIQKKVVRIPIEKSKELNKLLKVINLSLPKDTEESIQLLTKLLLEKFNNE